MITLNQLATKKRLKKHRRTKYLALKGSPQKRGVCIKLSIIKPKKPNSAQRKIARIKLCNDKFITAYIPGQGHSLQEFSVVLVRAGRVRDLPGMKYKLIRQKLDFSTKETFNRKKRRSKFGVKKK